MIGAILGGVLGAVGSMSAANTQAAATNRQIDLQRDIYDDQTENFSPFLTNGTNAVNALAFDLGMGSAPTFGPSGMTIQERSRQVGGAGEWYQPERGDRRWRNNTVTQDYFTVGDQEFADRNAAQSYIDSQGTVYGGYQASPGFQNRLQTGIDAMDMSAASRGGVMSGAADKARMQYGQNLAAEDYGNHINRLMSMANMGQAAAGQQAAAGNNFATGASNAIGAGANATAAGIVGATNAATNTINNIYGQNTLNKLMAG